MLKCLNFKFVVWQPIRKYYKGRVTGETQKEREQEKDIVGKKDSEQEGKIS